MGTYLNYIEGGKGAFMKVTAFVGSTRKKHTYQAVERFLKGLRSHGDVETEIVMLSEQDIKLCSGCCSCFLKGEEFCPNKDDRDTLIAKIAASDGVIFATPNYAFQVSARMKMFLDRLAFILHRPRFFGKAFTSIVTQGIFGGNRVVKYLDFVGAPLGFNIFRGFYLTMIEPYAKGEKEKFDRAIDRQSKAFHSFLLKNRFPSPSLFQVMVFRMSRSGIKASLDDRNRDFRYYTEKGWFTSDYYYPVKLNPFKKLIGILFDIIGTRMGKKKKE